MRHVFLIIAHKNINQLQRLIQHLQSDRVDIYIHFDSKWNISQNEIKKFVESFQNTYAIEDRISGVLDTWSLVEIAMKLIEAANRESKKNGYHYGYYYLLSGQDYPIKPLKYILDFLDAQYPIPLIDCTPETKTNWIHSVFKRIRHVNLYNKINRISENPKIQKICKIPLYVYQEIETLVVGSPYKHLTDMGIKLYGGSAWWCLPEKVIVDILQTWNENTRLIKYFSKATTPEETFFQTMIMGSSLADRVVVNEPNETKQNCMTFAYFQDIDKPATGHPYIFTVNEFEKISKLHHLFARKFDIEIDSDILDRIDSHLLY